VASCAAFPTGWFPWWRLQRLSLGPQTVESQQLLTLRLIKKGALLEFSFFGRFFPIVARYYSTSVRKMISPLAVDERTGIPYLSNEKASSAPFRPLSAAGTIAARRPARDVRVPTYPRPRTTIDTARRARCSVMKAKIACLYAIAGHHVSRNLGGLSLTCWPTRSGLILSWGRLRHTISRIAYLAR
jgi:hypothetical protein